MTRIRTAGFTLTIADLREALEGLADGAYVTLGGIASGAFVVAVEAPNAYDLVLDVDSDECDADARPIEAHDVLVGIAQRLVALGNGKKITAAAVRELAEAAVDALDDNGICTGASGCLACGPGASHPAVA